MNRASPSSIGMPAASVSSSSSMSSVPIMVAAGTASAASGEPGPSVNVSMASGPPATPRTMSMSVSISAWPIVSWPLIASITSSIDAWSMSANCELWNTTVSLPPSPSDTLKLAPSLRS